MKDFMPPLFKEFLQLWHKHPPALKDEPVRLWWSVVKGQAHSDLTVDGVVTIYIQKVKGQVSYDVIMIRKKRSGQCSMPELGTSNLNGCTYAVVLPQNHKKHTLICKTAGVSL